MSVKTTGGKTRRPRAAQRPNTMILRRTLILMAVCGIAAFIVLAVKLYDIQITQHEYYQNLAVEQQTRQSTVTASRGTVFDTNGKILAMSASVDTVFISPYEMHLYEEDKNLIADTLSAILDVDKEGILKKMEDTASWYKTIKAKIEQEPAEEIRAFIKEHKIKSVHLEPDSKRYYPNSSLACHVIGFVGSENIGLEGLEAWYNKYLEGTDGRIVRLKNAKGTDMLFTDFEDYYDAQNGSDITLTIDSTIQFYVEKYLAQAIEDYDVQNGGACIVMHPKTGEILAMASYGGYDLNNYMDVSPEVREALDGIADEEEYSAALRDALHTQWRNKALVDTYEPGSVFKIITMAMALDENIVGLNDHFYCGGSMEVLGREPLKCWRSTGHGSQTLTEAMQHSCNVALVSIGLRVGAEKFYDYISAFGLKERTGIDLPGESGSLWWDEKIFKDKTNLSQLAAAAFGQTFNITPLQMITAVSAVVNGGNLMEPYVVKQIADPDGTLLSAKEPTVVRQVVSAETSDTMRAILEAVVGGKAGTGKNAYVPGYRIGGKTGTSQDVAGEAAGEGKELIVSFCGVAPADDPQVVVLLLLDNPSNSSGIYISGGNMAAPVVGRILSEVLPYIGVKPVYSDEEKLALDVIVPKQTGQTVAEATEALKKLGLTVRVVGDGETVTDQLPAANAAVAPNSRVILYAGQDRSPNMVTVPDLYGKSYEDAKKALEDAGLFIRAGGTLSTVATAGVSTQSIHKSELVAPGTIIEVTLVDKSILGHY